MIILLNFVAINISKLLELSDKKRTDFVSRISSCFKDLKNRSRTALIPFITAGDPQPKATTVLMHSLVEGGADIIELGIPFSDPMADGPVIQEASERALSKGTNLWDVLAIVKDFRRTDQKTPVVLMGYLNPVEALGYEKFANAAAQAGVDGILLVDLPPKRLQGLVSCSNKSKSTLYS